MDNNGWISVKEELPEVAIGETGFGFSTDVLGARHLGGNLWQKAICRLRISPDGERMWIGCKADYWQHLPGNPR